MDGWKDDIICRNVRCS